MVGISHFSSSTRSNADVGTATVQVIEFNTTSNYVQNKQLTIISKVLDNLCSPEPCSMMKGSPGVAIQGSEDGTLLVEDLDLVQLSSLDCIQERFLDLGSNGDIDVCILRTTMVEETFLNIQVKIK